MIRALTQTDASWVTPLIAAAYPLPPPREDYIAERIAAAGTPYGSPPSWSVWVGDPDVPAFAQVVYYEIPLTGHAVPVGPGWRSQVEPMLPLVDGLFTNGTMPRILMAGLNAAVATFPAASLAQPVWAALDEATAIKYGTAFGGGQGGLPVARRFKRQGRYVWMSRLQDARDVLARVLGVP